MAPKSQEIEPVFEDSGKSLLNVDGSVTKLIEWATQNATTPEEMLDLFEEAGLSTKSQATAGDYQLVSGEEKPTWCARHVNARLFVVQWNFIENREPRRDDEGNIELVDGLPVFGEYASMKIISAGGKFIINDSTQIGMYGQLRRETNVREQNNEDAAAKRTSTAGLMVPGGLKQNPESWYDTRTKKIIKRSELDDVTRFPMNFREKSKTTWSFNL